MSRDSAEGLVCGGIGGLATGYALASTAVAHRSEVPRILLGRVSPHRDRAFDQPHRRAGRDGHTWTRTYCIGGEVVESQAVLAADRLTSMLRLSVIDDGLICSRYVAYREAIPVTDVRTEVAWFGSGPDAISSGMGCAAERSSTRSRSSAAVLL